MFIQKNIVIVKEVDVEIYDTLIRDCSRCIFGLKRRTLQIDILQLIYY